MLSLLTSLLLLSTGVASGQLLQLLGTTWNVTEWAWQSSIVVGKSLFVTGGIYFSQPNPPEPAVVPYLEYGTVNIDLSSSWTSGSLTYVWTVPPFYQEVLQTNFWHDLVDNQIYAWGGWFENSSYQSSLLSMTQFGNGTVSWEVAPSPDEHGLSTNATAPFGCASVSSDTTFYCLGGANVANAVIRPNSQSTLLPVQGLVQYNFANRTWSNISTPGTASASYIIEAGGAFASNFGNAGFLVFIGGSEPADQTFIFGGNVQLVSMAVITLFDIASSTWYTQEATGEIPPGRIEFCLVAAASQNHSFEIFVYGGTTNSTYDLNNPNDEGFLNTYALSIPAFRWFKSNDSTPVRRAGHTCQLVGNRQMLSIGGVQPSSGVEQGQALDPWTNGIGVFDMTAFKWSGPYKSDDDVYQQPDVVRQYYLTGYQTPTWSDPALAKVFAFTPPPSPPLTPTPFKPNTGAIVGGVLAAVVVLVILAAGVFLLNRRRRRRRELEAAMRVQAEGEQLRKISELDNEKPRGELASPIPELSSPIPELASPIPEFPSPTPALHGMETSEKPVGTMSIAAKPLKPAYFNGQSGSLKQKPVISVQSPDSGTTAASRSENGE